MPKELAFGKPATRRYPDEEKAAAVRMVRTLRAVTALTEIPQFCSSKFPTLGRSAA